MSTTPNTRRLACEFVMAVATCGAAYYFLVDSANGKIAEVRRDIEAAREREAAQAGIGGLTDGQILELKRATGERVAEMRERSAPARDEAAMFARISELAATYSVRVEQLNPSAVQISGGGAVELPPGVQPGTPAAAAIQGAAIPAPSAPGAPDAPARAKDSRIGYTMSVTGGYSDIAEFVGSLAERLGYTVVRSVRISQPDLQRPDVLRAAIETEHFAVDLSAIKLPSEPPATKQPMPLAPAGAGASHATESE